MASKGIAVCICAPICSAPKTAWRWASYHRESRRIKAVFTVTKTRSARKRGKDLPRRFAAGGCFSRYRRHRLLSDRSTSNQRREKLPRYSIAAVSDSAGRFDSHSHGESPARLQKHRHDAHHQRLLLLHPVEWNIGESAGLLAAFCLAEKTTPRAVRENKETLAKFQSMLRDQGVELFIYADRVTGERRRGGDVALAAVETGFPAPTPSAMERERLVGGRVAGHSPRCALSRRTRGSEHVSRGDSDRYRGHSFQLGALVGQLPAAARIDGHPHQPVAVARRCLRRRVHQTDPFGAQAAGAEA